MVKVNQATVDTYLKDIIDSNIDWSASHISKKDIEELAQKVNEESYESEITNTRLQQEEIVADLVHNFLIPEVHKQSIQEKIERCQRKILISAHKEIFNATEEIIQAEGVEEVPIVDTENEINENVEEKSVMTISNKEIDESQKIESKDCNAEVDNEKTESGQLITEEVDLDEENNKNYDEKESNLDNIIENNDLHEGELVPNVLLNSEGINEDQELQKEKDDSSFDDQIVIIEDTQEMLSDSQLAVYENILKENDDGENKDNETIEEQ